MTTGAVSSGIFWAVAERRLEAGGKQIFKGRLHHQYPA
jgi:hypothetical protein